MTKVTLLGSKLREVFATIFFYLLMPNNHSHAALVCLRSVPSMTHAEAPQRSSVGTWGPNVKYQIMGQSALNRLMAPQGKIFLL